MQKLVFKNGKGTEINLTSGDYGITEWQGFSNTELNLQTQQVPFSDGSVYLDGLLSERELVVTLAIQDGNDLEKRYRLRREIISVMNPKLGEGLLIYTNDYTSKQIHVIPQIPTFENHNSNDSGTPKAQLSWTACNPYWEDVEETEATLYLNKTTQLLNEGDVKTLPDLDIITNSVTNLSIINQTTGKEIQLSGNIKNNTEIVLQRGKKNVLQESKSIFLDFYSRTWTLLCYSKRIGRLIWGIGNILCYTDDGINTTCICMPERVTFLLYSNILQKYVSTYGGYISLSEDGISWEKTNNQLSVYSICEVDETIYLACNDGIYKTNDCNTLEHILTITKSTSVSYPLKQLNILYVSKYNRLIVGGFGTVNGVYGVLWYSDDYGATWTQGTTPTLLASDKISALAINNYTNRIVASCNRQDVMAYSDDGINWNVVTLSLISSGKIHNTIYIPTIDKFLAVGDYSLLISADGEQWSISNCNYLYNSIFIEESDSIYICGENTNVQYSKDLINWITLQHKTNLRFNDYVFADKIVIPCQNNKLLLSADGSNWEIITTPSTIKSVIWVESEQMYYGISGTELLKSADAINWSVVSFDNHSRTLTKIIYFSETQSCMILCSSRSYFYSDDLIDWHLVNVSEIQYDITDVIYSSSERNYYAVVGVSIYYSESLSNYSWHNCIINYGNLVASTIKKISFSPQLQLYIGIGASTRYIYISKYGKYWDVYNNTDVFLTDIKYIPEFNCFVGTGSYLIYKTSDGVNFEKEYNVNITANLIDINKMTKELMMLASSSGYSLVFEQKRENYINVIEVVSANSDLNFFIDLGINKVRLTSSSGKAEVKIKYRQKYLGV